MPHQRPWPRVSRDLINRSLGVSNVLREALCPRPHHLRASPHYPCDVEGGGSQHLVLGGSDSRGDGLGARKQGSSYLSHSSVCVKKKHMSLHRHSQCKYINKNTYPHSFNQLYLPINSDLKILTQKNPSWKALLISEAILFVCFSVFISCAFIGHKNKNFFGWLRKLYLHLALSRS